MSLAPILRQSLKLNRAGWRPGAATRCALVLALVLVGGSLAGHPTWGVAAAIGAFNTGLASLTGVYRTRLKTMLQVCGVTFVCALIGGLVGPSLPLAVLTLTLGCLLLTVYGEAVPAAATLTLQATMTLLILSGLRLAPAAVPGTALLVLLGGLAQVMVLGVLWPLGRHHPEHRAVSLTYAALADFVAGWEEDAQRGVAAPGRLFPDDAPFQGAQSALNSVPVTRRRASHTELAALLEEAEGLRAALISLGLQPWVRGQAEVPRLFRRVLTRTLTQVRRGVSQGQTGPDEALISPGALRALRFAALRAAPVGEVEKVISALALTLDLLTRLSLTARPPIDPVLPYSLSPAPAAPTLPFWWLRPTPAQFTPAQWQHGWRLAVAVGLSDLLVRLLALPHGYWLPLTVGLVLRADYLTTLTRGVARLLGTLAAVLAGPLLGLAHPGVQLDTLFVLGAAWLAYALVQVGYAPFSAAVSLYVIMSVSASGLSQGAVAEGRLLYTVLGGLVALVAFLLWPLWVSGTAGERLRQAAGKQLAYADALLAACSGSVDTGVADPGLNTVDSGETALEQTRSAARSARVSAEGVVAAAVAEPVWATRGQRDDAAPQNMALLSANAARLLALHLALRRAGSEGARSALRTALGQARQVSAQLAGEGQENSTVQ